MTRFAKNFNLFKPLSKRPPSVPVLECEKQLQLKQQLLSTRVYIIFLFFFTTALILYTSLRYNVEMRRFSVSSYSDYQNLSVQFRASSLSCPCTIISNEYSNFISIASKALHPVDVSPLFDPRWIGLQISLTNVPIEENLPLIFVYYLQFTKNLCFIARTFAQARIERFLSTFYTTSFLTDKKHFEKDLELQVDRFIQLLASQYKHLIEVSRAMISSNSLLPAVQTNYEWDLIRTPNNQSGMPYISDILYINKKWKKYRNQTYSCQIPSKFYKKQLYFPRTKIPVPGMYLSCYLIDGLLQSTLECFFNINCLELLRIHMFSQYNISAGKFDEPSNSSLYRANSTVQELIDILFVAEWSVNITYSSYYDKCQPKECHYAVIKKFQLSYVMAITCSILSGSLKALPIVIPLLVKICFKLWKYRKVRHCFRRQGNNNRIKPVKPSLSA
ncbi:unnamed protein product [Adineta ricciae]|uniref:Uncharacterized protein n=1 Tax=Adineta ricciae TaxID=249248 RepID=A0A814K1S1_ADIRI|nr:unnamed protein product [Adineta ricciae]CAF1425900.1 unnamed protein product [Adineta ricciae]